MWNLQSVVNKESFNYVGKCYVRIEIDYLFFSVNRFLELNERSENNYLIDLKKKNYLIRRRLNNRYRRCIKEGITSYYILMFGLELLLLLLTILIFVRCDSKPLFERMTSVWRDVSRALLVRRGGNQCFPSFYCVYERETRRLTQVHYGSLYSNVCAQKQLV